MSATVLTVEPGDYEVSSRDNLLIFTNYTASESYVFDIKSPGYVGLPFCTVIHKPHQPLLQPLSFSAVNKHDHLSFSYDALQSRSTCETTAKDITDTVYSELPEGLLQFTSEDLSCAEGICYRLDLDCEVLVRNHPDLLEASLFMLRRTGYKFKAFELIRTAIRRQASLLTFSSFFEAVNSNYKTAALERRHMRRRSETSFSELKVESGVTVLLQSDLSSLVFTPLFDDTSVDNFFLGAVLTEYVHSLSQMRLAVHQGIQELLLRVLVRGHSFPTLQQLIQYHVITDSVETAQFLIALASPSVEAPYPPAFQLGVDMLARVKATADIAYSLIEHSLLLESLPILRECLPTIDNRLHEEVAKLKDPELQEVILRYLKDC